MAETVSKEQLRGLFENQDFRDDLLKSLIESKKSDKLFNNEKAKIQANDLVERRKSFEKKYDIKEGDIVVWKENLKNRKFPYYGQPAIVMKVYSSPVYDRSATSSTSYFEEPLDVTLGIIDENDGEFMIFHFDSRRFRPKE